MIRLAFALLCLLIAGPARADELKPGYIEFTQIKGETWKLVWRVPNGAGLRTVNPVLPASCIVSHRVDQTIIATATTTVFVVKCAEQVFGKSIGLPKLSGSQSDVLVRVAPLGHPVQVMRLTPLAPSAEFRATPDRFEVARTYFVTGVEHILSGFDHLLFVIALVLLVSDFTAVVKAVTAFTVAHSITLIGTTLGLIGLPQRPVEAVIALSIMFLAVEIVKRKPGEPRLAERVPWAVAFVFGLLHGFGFAGALKEIGLPSGDISVALLTFNLGVEAGQMIIVLATLATLAMLARYAAPLKPHVMKAASYAIGITASFWFIERIFV